MGQVDWVACVWGSGWPSRTWWYTTLCVFAAYWTLQGEHGVGPSLVDQVAGAQVGQVYLGDLCLWLQVDLQPYLYGGAAWWPPQWVGPAAGAQVGQVNWVNLVTCGYGCRWTS